MNTISTYDEPITNTLTNAEKQTPPIEQKGKAKVQAQLFHFSQAPQLALSIRYSSQANWLLF